MDGRRTPSDGNTSPFGPGELKNDGRLMSPAQETQSMREIKLLRGRLPRKGGGLTGM
jgi:hypothetical protein